MPPHPHLSPFSQRTFHLAQSRAAQDPFSDTSLMVGQTVIAGARGIRAGKDQELLFLFVGMEAIPGPGV